MEPKELRFLSMKGCISCLLQSDDAALKDYPAHIQRMLVRDSLRILENFFVDITTRYKSGNLWSPEKYKRVKKGQVHQLIPDKFRLFSIETSGRGGRKRVWIGARSAMRALKKLQLLDRKLSPS